MLAKACLQKPAQALFMIPFVMNLYLLGKAWWFHFNIGKYTFFCMLELDAGVSFAQKLVGLAEYLCSIHYKYPQLWFLNPYILYDVSLIINRPECVAGVNDSMRRRWGTFEVSVSNLWNNDDEQIKDEAPC